MPGSGNSWRCLILKQPLYRSLDSLVESGQNFAYFCKFSDEERINGQEFLFDTEEKPLFFKDNVKSGLNDVLPEIIGAIDSRSFLPVFVSYGLVENIFNLNLRKKPVLPATGLLIPSSEKRNTISRTPSPGITGNDNHAEISEDERKKLENNLGEVIERIRAGELLQTVISHRFNVEEFNGMDLLSYMIENDRSRYVYYYRMGDLEIVGSSPESVFVRSGKSITIHPIAGTRRRYSNSDSELIASLKSDSKELCEHRMLVDLARNDLSRISLPGSVKVQSNMVAEKFYSVIHLTSTVNGTLAPDVTQYDILSSIFPAGTVSGAPKRRAIEIIDRYEQYDRGVYGGAVGIIGKDNTEMALPIRTAFNHGGKAYVQAGAGIVKDSVPEREVDEMIAKANTIVSGGLVCV